MTNKRTRDRIGGSRGWVMLLWQQQAAECRTGPCLSRSRQQAGKHPQQALKPACAFRTGPTARLPQRYVQVSRPALAAVLLPDRAQPPWLAPAPHPCPPPSCILSGFCFRIRASPQLTIDLCWGQFRHKMPSPAVWQMQQLAKHFYELRNL